MDLFTYLGAKNGKFTLPHKSDLFAYLLGKNSKLPVQTASGTTLEITAKKTNILELTLDKMCSQDGTPTPDNPIPVIVAEGYRNYFDSINPERSQSVGCNITKTDSNNYTLSGTAAWSSYTFTYKNELKNTNMIIKGIFKESVLSHAVRIVVYGTDVLNYGSSDLTTLRNGDTINLDLDTDTEILEEFNSGNYDYLVIRFFNNSSSSALETTTSLSITNCYLGLPNLPYVPYGTNYINLNITDGVNTVNKQIPLNDNFIGGIGDYEDKIDKSTGKNLFDGTIKNIAFATSGNKVVIVESSTYRGCYIPCEAGKTYSVSRLNNSNGRFRVMFSASLPVAQTEVFDGTRNVETYDTALKIEGIVAPNNAKYLVIYLSNSSQEIPPIMLNEGSTALPYEPYGTGNWYIKKNIGKVVLDGSENWNYSSYVSQYYRILTNITNKRTNSLNSAKADLITNYFKPGIWNNGTGQGESVIELNGESNAYFIINQNELSDTSTQTNVVESFKTWLSTHNTTLYYVVETPTTVDLGNIDISLFKGTNIITNSDNCNMTIKYY